MTTHPDERTRRLDRELERVQMRLDDLGEHDIPAERAAIDNIISEIGFVRMRLAGKVEADG